MNLGFSAAAGYRPLKGCTPKYFAILLMINRRHRDLGHLSHGTDLCVDPRQHCLQDGQGEEEHSRLQSQAEETEVGAFSSRSFRGQHTTKPNLGTAPRYSGRCISTAHGSDSTRATSLPGALLGAAIVRYGNPQSLSRRLIAFSRSFAGARNLQKVRPFAIAIDCRSRPRPTSTRDAMLGVLAGET